MFCLEEMVVFMALMVDFFKDEKGYGTVEISIILCSLFLLVVMVFKASFLSMKLEIGKSDAVIEESEDQCDIEDEIKKLRRWQFVEQSL